MVSHINSFIYVSNDVAKPLENFLKCFRLYFEVFHLGLFFIIFVWKYSFPYRSEYGCDDVWEYTENNFINFDVWETHFLQEFESKMFFVGSLEIVFKCIRWPRNYC